MNLRRFYVVRLRSDDSVIASGRTEECAKAMRMSISSFRTTVHRCRNGKNQKYEIDVEMEADNEQQCIPKTAPRKGAIYL